MHKRILINALLLLFLSFGILTFASCEAEKDPAPTESTAVSGVTLDKTELMLTVGGGDRLIATVAPDTAKNKTLTWTSGNTLVATVDVNGNVSAKGAGVTEITVTTADGGFSATCRVTVTAIPVSSVALDTASLKMSIGETKALAATISPQNATNTRITWKSSDESVATVDSNGNITALRDVSAIITVTTLDGGFTAECAVTVDLEVSKVTLNTTSLDLFAGQTYQLTATVLPENAENKALTWTSNKPDIVSVDENGNVTAHKNGIAMITATSVSGRKTSTCVITVRIPASSVTLNHNSLTLGVGDSLTLTATVLPSNASSTKVTWRSTNPSAVTVTSGGVISAVGTGSATIVATAEAGGVYAECSVNVPYIPVTAVTLPSSLSLDVGDAFVVTPVISPANPSFGAISWSSSDPSVVSVSNGRLTAHKTGSAVIRATADGVTGSCTVTVSAVGLTLTNAGTRTAVLASATGSVKDGVNTFYWQANSAKRITLPSVMNVSKYRYITFRIYSEAATGEKVQIRFSYADDTKLPSNGMAPYFRYEFVVDFTGWRDVRLDMNTLAKNYSPTWTQIAYIGFDRSGWDLTGTANTKLYFTDMIVEAPNYTLNVTGSKTEAEHLALAKLRWREFLSGDGTGGTNYNKRVQTIEANALKFWKTNSASYQNTYVGSGKDSAGTLFNIVPRKAYNTESDITDIYYRIQTMALGYATEGTSCYKDPTLLAAIKNSLDYVFNNYYGEDHLTDVEYRQWVNQTNWWYWQIGIPSYVVDILMLLETDLTQSEIDRYLIPVDYFVPRVSMTACNRLWLGKVAYASAILQNDSVRALTTLNDLGEIFEYVTSGDGFYEDGSFIQHISHPYTGGYGLSTLFELTQFMVILGDGAFRIPDESASKQYSWVFDTFEPIIYNQCVMTSVIGREATRYTEQTKFQTMFACLVMMADYAPDDVKARLESMIKYYLTVGGDSVISGNVPINLVEYVYRIKNDPSIKARSDYEITKVFGNMDRVVQHRPEYSVALAFSSTRVFKYEAINSENMTGWYQGDGMIYVYTPGYSFGSAFFNNADPYKLPGTTVTAAVRNEQNVSPSIYGSSDFVGGVAYGKYGVSAMILGYAPNSFFTTDITARKSYFTFDNEIICIGSGISESVTGAQVYTTVENRLIRSGDVFKVDGAVANNGTSSAKYAHFTNMGGYVFKSPTEITYAKRSSYLEITISHGVNPTNGSYFYIYLPCMTEAETKAYSDSLDSRITVLSESNSVHAVRDNDIGVTGYVFYEATSCNGVSVSAPCIVMITEANGTRTLSVSDPTHKLSSVTVTVDGNAHVFDVSGNVGNTFSKTI